MGKLDGKVAVVTGAGGGVGRAYALALAAAGARVVVNDVGRAAAEGVVGEIEAAGGTAAANDHDVSDFAAAGRIIDAAVQGFGRIDILIANAGIIRPVRMHEASEADWANVLAVHANGTFNCYRHAAPHLIAQDSGTVITTGAGLMQGYFPGLGAYRAAKAAILVLTLTAARELAGRNINVNSVMPGATDTPMQRSYMASLETVGVDLSGWRPAAPVESVPPLGVFLCTDEARPITGQSFHVYSNSISVASSFGDLTPLQADGDRWGEGELARKAPAWLSGLGLQMAEATL